MMISIDGATAEIVITLILIMGAGVVTGALVQNITKFVLPIDFITWAIPAWIAIDVLFGILNINILVYIPFISGYVIGYIVRGRQKYIMFALNTMSIKLHDEEYNVLYDHKNEKCIADQTNRALFKRLFLGIHHVVKVKDAAGFEPDWTFRDKRPCFPVMEAVGFFVEKMPEPMITEKRFLHFFKLHAIETTIVKAHGSMTSNAQLVMEDRALQIANENWWNAEQKSSAMALTMSNAGVKIASDWLMESTLGASPGNLLAKHMGEDRKAEIRKQEERQKIVELKIAEQRKLEAENDRKNES